MDIKKIISNLDQAQPYVKGTATMWTDSHISKFLLEAHLNPDIGVASRTRQDIEKTVDMIDEMIEPGSRILDLGCGPGLYAQGLAQKKHQVIGVDFSKNSIDYARKQQKGSQLDIEYLNENYLNLDFEEQFDLIMMIYCDFGALIPEERSTLLQMIHKALKPGGIFLFDAIDEDTIARIDFNPSWEISPGGFWQPDPYICLTKNHYYSQNKATLEEHVIIDESGDFKIYRFWNHYFNLGDVKQMVSPFGFGDVQDINNVVNGQGVYNDHGVVFYLVRK